LVFPGADSYIEKLHLGQITLSRQQTPTVVVMTRQGKPNRSQSLAELVQVYMGLLGQRARKTASLLQSQPAASPVVICQPAALAAVVKTGRQPQSLNHGYVHQSIVRSSGLAWRPGLGSRHSLSRHPRHWLGLILAVCQSLVAVLTPVLVTYFIYLAVHLHEPSFLLLTLAGLTVLLIFGVWEDDHLRFRQRLAYTAGIPLTFAWLYIWSWSRLKPFSHA